MYLNHFGLKELPFTLTPDTSFFYDRGNYHEALNVLLLAIRSGEGFVKITGEVGTGKTLLCRKLLNTLGESYLTAYLPDPLLHAHALRRALAAELGLSPHQTADRQTLALQQRLLELNRAGRHVVLLIDEAQVLPDDSLEAVRLLTNLETERHKLLQVVLFGQHELDARLERPQLRQLRQRITFAYRLRPLDSATVEDYLQHRLQVAGYRGRVLFTPAALRVLVRDSRGIPRLVNILAHKALMAAYGRGDALVTSRHVRRAAADTGVSRAAPLYLASSLGYAALGLLTVLATGFGLYLSGGVWR